MAFTSFAFLSFGTSAFVSSRFIQRYGPVASCAAGLSAISTALFVLSYLSSHSIGVGVGATALAAAALYYTGVPLYGPTIPTMLLQCVPANKRGAVMGFDGTINTISRYFACTASALALIRRWIVLRKDFLAGQTQTEINNGIHALNALYGFHCRVSV
eukprot:scaffold33190_cov37-Cyclotella_meneghiniana.AAC.6